MPKVHFLEFVKLLLFFFFLRFFLFLLYSYSFEFGITNSASGVSHFILLDCFMFSATYSLGSYSFHNNCLPNRVKCLYCYSMLLFVKNKPLSLLHLEDVHKTVQFPPHLLSTATCSHRLLDSDVLQ